MSSFLIALLVPLVLAALGIAVRPTARRVGEKRVVEYGAGLRGFAAFTTALAVAIAIASLFINPEDRPSILFIAAIFALPSAYLLPHAYLTRFDFDDQGILAASPWQKQTFVAWEDIVDVRYSAAEKSYVVVAPSGFEMKLHAYMSGVPDLVAEMQRRGVRGVLLAQAAAG